MSGDFRGEGGSTCGEVVQPGQAGEQSCKFSSILAFLDHVSDDVSKPHRGQRGNNGRIVRLDAGVSLSPSSISSLGQEGRRRPRQQQSRPSPSSYRHDIGESTFSASGVRVPWDNSIKDSKLPTATSRGTENGRNNGWAPHERSSSEGGGSGRRGTPSTSDTMTVQHHDRQASTLSTRNRTHRGVADYRYSVAARGDLVSLRGPKHMVDGGGGGGGGGGGNGSYNHDDSDDAPDDKGTASPTVTVERKAQQRWVWDDWEDHRGDFSSPFFSSAGNTESSIKASNQTVASFLSPSEKMAPAAVADEAPSVPAGDNRALSSILGRDKHRMVSDTNGDACTMTAKKAFEDVQATARAMKANLKEKRSEVLDLKANLQRVRASNERRRAKLSEQWAARIAAAAEEKMAAAERHRAFAKQLEADVDALEGKLGGLERQARRFQEGRDRDCALARAECARELKKARESWMAAEKGRLQRLFEKKAVAIKQAAVRALEPQLSELVKANRAESRMRADELEEVLLGLQASLERETAEQVQTEARDYQASLETEVEEDRRQAEHQLRLLGRSNEADIQELREATRRDLEGERVRFEAARKRAREAADKELEEARAAEADRAATALAEHARELREIEEAHRQEEQDTRRRLADETDRFQKQAHASARKEAEERDEIAKREAREKCNEELDMVLRRLEAEAAQARNAVRAQAQQVAAEAAASQAKDLEAAQELETRAMERYLDCARQQAEIESEVKGLEEGNKAVERQIREETERLATAEQQLKEGRERWACRLERLQEECSDERKAAREEVSRLSRRAEEAEAAARRAAAVYEEESAGLRASLSAEFEQVEAKVAAVLNRKTEQESSLKERLSTLQGQTKAREEELADHRRRTFS